MGRRGGQGQVPAGTWGKGSTSRCQNWAGDLACTPCTSPHGPLVVCGGAQPFPSFPFHSEADMEIQGDQLLSLTVEPENPAGASLEQCAGMLHYHVENKSLCV